jgi:glycosyltransferase involved in cell wall biosynthesis
MRIGILGPCPPPHGGVTRVIENNAHFWKEEGIECYLIPMEIPENLTSSPDLELVDYRKYSSLNDKFFTFMKEAVRFPGLYSYTFFRYNTALYKIIKEFDIDILYAHHTFHGGLSAVLQSKLLSIPAVVVSYGQTWMVTESDKKHNKMQKFVLENADHVISTSEHCRQGAIKIGADPSKTDVVYAGIDLDKFNPNVDGTEFRKKHEIGNDEIVVSLLGLVLKRKIDTFIKCLVHLNLKPEKDVKVLIGGVGEDYSYLESMIQKHDLQFVNLLGFVPDAELPQFYAATDIFVVAQNTLVECMGQSMKEAMACGVSVVGSNIGGVPEAISDNETGLLFVPDNPEDLAKKIKILIDDKDLRERIGRNARGVAVEKFDARTSAKKTLKIFEGLIIG